MQNSDGIIVILSYPDTIVRPAYWEKSSKIWPIIGIGGKHAVQAGHAALLLIKKGQKKIEYFDFGRYITTYRNGRVRGEETDPELVIPISAEFENDELLNIEDILLWLEKHPEKTHGEGRLVASINSEINFNKANSFIHSLINQKEVPYGAFIKNGTNCARFVTDTIINSSTNIKMASSLKKSNRFTPSPIGNVIKGTTSNTIYEVYNQEISEYHNRSIVKEYKAAFFKRLKTEPNLIGTELPNKEVFDLKDGTWLGGIGSGAWFKIENKISENTYSVLRFNADGENDFKGNFKTTNSEFDILEAYKFIHPTSCKQAFIEQNKNIFILNKVD